MVESNNQFYNLQWTGYITTPDIKNMNKYQKINHFPNSTQLGRKDLLWRNINRLRMKFPKEFNITPMSYSLSEEYEAF
jgi:tubulin polyglutamylase TTLL4